MPSFPSAPEVTDNDNGPALQSGPRKKDRKAKSIEQIEALRSVPSSHDAERGLLSSMLQDPGRIIDEVIPLLSPAAFHHPAHELIYTILLELQNKRTPIDIVTLTQTLIDRNQLEEIGGASYIAELGEFAPTSANFATYAHIIRDKYILRRVISSCTECITSAYEEQEDVQPLLDTVEQRILQIREMGAKDQKKNTKEEVIEAVKVFEEMVKNKGGTHGTTTGLKDLDAMTDGLHGGEMFIIAARPAMGKTSLVMNVVEHIACDLNQPALVFSLEMSTQQLIQRLLCARAGVPLNRFRDGFATKEDFRKLTKAASQIAASKLFVDDTPGVSILELRAKARRIHNQHPLKIIAVDYLQLMKSNTKRAQENRQIEVAEISAGLKAIAKELNVPVMVLAQLNRNPEGRADNKPKLSDLRESGSIEQDADVVGLLVRSAYYATNEDERDERQGEAELIIAKQRNGPTGEIPLTFINEIMRFRDRARTDDDE
ncbi:replicative DNA helicase [Sulfuriroseicoccus oceanibius]|uniref:Replicative DNA helicase n=1 Tax=Sulfuriroseicoccus oceanibius TaxID=2707525 RepID=A0A6B3LE24_9BACT|nr:replicative DNA helicase [Sulfuriroseicoccus oceanibius]QQL45875.1 replicative DNA helicase [Sulfuriroseicoccus oceanibius]